MNLTLFSTKLLKVVVRIGRVICATTAAGNILRNVAPQFEQTTGCLRSPSFRVCSA